MRRFLLWAGLLLLLVSGCEAPPLPPEPLRLGLAVQPSSVLVMIALDQGFLSQEGLAVTVTPYPSGKRAMQEGLFAGEVDVVTTLSVPVARAALSRDDFRILGVTARVDGLGRVVARRDHGIATVEDLRGKHVATQKFSGLHYFFHLFLQDHFLAEEDLSLTFAQVETLPELLASGQVDAIVVREPYSSQAESLLGERALSFVSPDLLEQKDMLVSGAAFAETPAAQKLLRGILSAEEYARSHPQAVADSLTRWMNADAAQKAASLFRRSHVLRLTLSEHGLVRLEEQSRWLMHSDPARSMPEFLHLIHAAPLLAVNPDRVSLIR